MSEYMEKNTDGLIVNNCPAHWEKLVVKDKTASFVTYN